MDIARLDEVLARADVQASIERSRAAIDEVRWHSALRRHSADAVSESIVRGAWASARCEGVDIGLDEVRAGSFDGLSQADLAVINGAIRATQARDAMLAVWQRAPLQALARVHALAAAGLVGDDVLGRPRAALADEDRPPSARLQELAAWARETTAPGLVVFSIVTGQLLRLQPFGNSDAVVARAIGRVVLASRGLDEVGVCVPEYGWMTLLPTLSPTQGDPNDVEDLARWVSRCADVLVAGAEEGRRVCEDVASR